MNYYKPVYDKVIKSLQKQGTYAHNCWFCEYPLGIDDVKKGECPNCEQATSTLKKPSLIKRQVSITGLTSAINYPRIIPLSRAGLFILKQKNTRRPMEKAARFLEELC